MTASSGQLANPPAAASGEKTTSAPMTSEPKPRLSWLALTIIFTNLGLAILALVGWLEFGSISSGLGYLRGDRLIPDAYTKSFGVASPGETRTVEFQLTNYTNHTVTIVGFKSSCTCASATELPIVIHRLVTVTLKVNYHAKTNQAPTVGGFQTSQNIRLYTDDTRLASPILILTGQVATR